MESEIIVAHIEHIPELVELINAAYRGDSSTKGWTTEAHLLDGQRIDESMLNEMISSENSKVLLLLSSKNSNSASETQLEACIHIKKLNSQDAYFGLLTVNPLIQNKGLGKLLLNAAEKWIRLNWNSTKLSMKVISTRSELIAWYERRGFIKTQNISDFPMNDSRFGIPKVPHIEFIEFKKILS